MRIRQVKPSFFTDPLIAEVSYPARLFYIGLWCVADDDGWIEWEPPTIGVLLLGYEPARRRLSLIERWTKELVAAGRLKLLDCGCAVIPTLPVHQRHAGGNRSYQVRDTHRRAHLRTSPDESGPVQKSRAGTVGNGKGNGTVGNGSAREVSDKRTTGEGPFTVIDGKLVEKGVA